MRITPTIARIEAFLQAAETGSFSCAAAAAGVAQSTLSRTVRALEEVLDLPLFHRDTRNVEVTEAGQRFRPQAARMLAEFNGMLAELADVAGGRHGSLTIACLPSIAAVILPGALARFRRDHPDMEVGVRDSLAQSVLDRVAEGEADLGLTVQPRPRAKLSYRQLLTDAFYLVCRSDDPLAGVDALPWSALGERDFLAMAPASSVRAMTNAAFLQAGLVARPLTDPVLCRSIGVVTRSGRPLSAASAALLAAVTIEALALK
jgi:DNA-binding transcriptional LysR family regulator